jgi:outer membrane receptor protein involved in Fe transport
VINIITKRGATGGTQYSFAVKQGTNWFMNDAERVGANYWRNPGTGQIEGVNVIETEKARGTPVFRNGLIQDYSANVSGGAGTLRYFASGDIANNEGAEPNNARRQISGRTNLSITPSEKFDLQSSAGYIQSHTTLSCEAGCGGAMWGAMYSNPANLAANCTPQPECGWSRGFQSSPPESDRAMQDWQDINRFTGSLTANVKPATWLTGRLSVGTDFTQEKNEELLPHLTNDTLRYFWGTFADGWKYQNRRDIVFNTYDFNSTARFQVTPIATSATSVGVQYYTKHFSSITAEGDYFPAPGLETIGSAAAKVVTLDDYSDNNTLGFYVQEQVGLRDRLFLTGAVRVDNNSAFGKDIKWVTYPKASLSWILHDEPFARDFIPNLVNSFKLRLAYGHSGQQPQVFTALRTLTPVAGPAGTGALSPLAVGNPGLKPERGIETEAGFDASFLDDRLGLDFTYYHTATKDAILSRGVAPSTGFGGSSQFVNAGEILNQGIELLFKAQVLNRQRFSWESTLNLSRNVGKIRKLSGSDTTIDLGSVSHRIGYAPWSYFERRVISAEYNPVTQRTFNQICDDGRGGSMPCYTPAGLIQAPKVFLGRTVPSIEGAWSNTVRFFDHFRATGMIDFKAGYKRLDNNLRIRCQIFLTCLEVLNPATTDPARLAQMQSNGTLRDFVINNARFAKLRELSLAYDAPQRLASRLSARSLTLSIAGRNLHTWTPYTGLDPESMFLSGSPNFVDQAELPQLASFVFTLQLTY